MQEDLEAVQCPETLPEFYVTAAKTSFQFLHKSCSIFSENYVLLISAFPML